MNERKQKAILWCLQREPGMRGFELSNVTGIWQAQIYIYLGRMENAGLIRRVVTQDFNKLSTPISVRYYIAE